MARDVPQKALDEAVADEAPLTADEVATGLNETGLEPIRLQGTGPLASDYVREGRR